MSQISGKISKDGSSSNNHFKSTKSAIGVYEVTFNCSFVNVPTVLLTIYTEVPENGFYVVGVSIAKVTNKGFTVNVAYFDNPATDSAFNFLAME